MRHILVAKMVHFLMYSLSQMRTETIDSYLSLVCDRAEDVSLCRVSSDNVRNGREEENSMETLGGRMIILHF